MHLEKRGQVVKKVKGMIRQVRVPPYRVINIGGNINKALNGHFRKKERKALYDGDPGAYELDL